MTAHTRQTAGGRLTIIGIAAVLTAVAVTAALTLVVAGGAEADHVPIHPVPLTTDGHNEFTDDVAIQVRDKPEGRSTKVVNLPDASNIAVFEFTIQPGAWFPWHTHPGVVLAAVAEGDFVYLYADDCIPRPYDQGEAFVDPGLAHTGYNPSETEETVVIATILGVPAGAPPATPVDADEATALNEECGIEAPVPPEADNH